MKDNDHAIITPSSFKLPPLHQHVILFFILNHFYLFRDLINGAKVKSYGSSKRFDFVHEGLEYSALGGFIGAPLAAIILENAIVSGAKHVKAFGSAGWIGQTSCEIGKLYYPAAALDKTGMMSDYGAEQPVTRLKYKNVKPSCRNIVSVNSFYRLTKEKLAEYRAIEADLIDMEAAPLNYISQLRGVTYQPLFIVSDAVDPTFKWINGTKTDAFRSGLERGLLQLLSLS